LPPLPSSHASEATRVQHRGHRIVVARHPLVRVPRDDRARRDHGAFGVLPGLPKPSEPHQATIGHREVVRDLVALRPRPLVEARRRDDAATLHIGLSKHLVTVDGLDAGIEGRTRLPCLFLTPTRDETPPAFAITRPCSVRTMISTSVVGAML